MGHLGVVKSAELCYTLSRFALSAREAGFAREFDVERRPRDGTVPRELEKSRGNERPTVSVPSGRID